MIGLDYRTAYLKSQEDDDEEEEMPAPPSTRGIRRCKSTDGDSETSVRKERKGLLERTGSFRLERKGSFRLERKGSFRLLPGSKNGRGGGKEEKYEDDDDEISLSGSISSSMSNSISSTNWGNISVGDLTMSIASFGFHSSGSHLPGKLEPEVHVLKLLDQIQDRINTRRVRQKEYQKRINSCLELAIARFEAGSSNHASLVSMRRVDKLRDGFNRVKDVETQLQELHGQITADVQQARLMAGENAEVLVDVDLDHLRGAARKVEQDANARPFVEKTDAELLAELKTLSGDAPIRQTHRLLSSSSRNQRGTRRRLRKKLNVHL